MIWMLGWAQTSLFNRHISFPIASWRVSDTVDDRAARQRDRLERWYDRKFVKSKSYIWVRITPCSSTDWGQLSSGKLCVRILEDRLNGGQQWWPAAPGVGSMSITSRLQKWFFFCLALVRQHGVQCHQHHVGYFPLCISWIWFFFFLSLDQGRVYRSLQLPTQWQIWRRQRQTDPRHVWWQKLEHWKV